MEKLNEINNQLMAAPAGVLVMFFTFMFGLALKKTEKVSNNMIPLCILCAGCALWIFCALANCPPEDSNFLRKWMPWMGTNLCIGFTLPGLTWIFHRFAWKRIEKKMGLNGFNTEIITKPKEDEKTNP